MRVKTFTAPTMAEAMEQVRRTLGPDAIIISTHEARRGRGAEIRAAVERAPRQEAPICAPESITPHTLKPAPSHAAHTAAAQSAPDHGERQWARLRKALVIHGFSKALGNALLNACQAMDEPDLEEALARTIDMRFSLEPVALVPARPLMLIGPPGVGKTATTAKLAARAVLRGHRPRLFTTDTLRTGAVDQLARLAEVMKCTVTAIDTPAAMKTALGNAAAGTASPAPVFIDTPATNPYAHTEIDDLRGFIDAVDAEPILVLAAGSDGAELIDTIKAFRPLGTARVIITRIDASRRLGSVLSAVDACHLTLSQYSQSPYIGAGLETFMPQDVAQRILAVQPDSGSAGAGAQSKPSLEAKVAS